MPTLDPTAMMMEGVAILATKLRPLGFSYEIKSWQQTSGGPAADVIFRNGDRELLISFRYSLGLVRYRKGTVELDHKKLMRALGCYSKAKYPGFSSEPLDAFRDLLSDLDYCDVFFQEDGAAFLQVASDANKLSNGFFELSDHQRDS